MPAQRTAHSVFIAALLCSVAFCAMATATTDLCDINSVDIILMVDNSVPFGAANFDAVRAFAQSLIQAADTSVVTTRLGLVQVGSSPSMSLTLNGPQSSAILSSRLQNLGFGNHPLANWRSAFQFVSSNIVPQLRSRGEGVSTMLLWFSDVGLVPSAGVLDAAVRVADVFDRMAGVILPSFGTPVTPATSSDKLRLFWKMTTAAPETPLAVHPELSLVSPQTLRDAEFSRQLLVDLFCRIMYQQAALDLISGHLQIMFDAPLPPLPRADRIVLLSHGCERPEYLVITPFNATVSSRHMSVALSNEDLTRLRAARCLARTPSSVALAVIDAGPLLFQTARLTQVAVPRLGEAKEIQQVNACFRPFNVSAASLSSWNGTSSQARIMFQSEGDTVEIWAMPAGYERCFDIIDPSTALRQSSSSWSPSPTDLLAAGALADWLDPSLDPPATQPLRLTGRAFGLLPLIRFDGSGFVVHVKMRQRRGNNGHLLCRSDTSGAVFWSIFSSTSTSTLQFSYQPSASPGTLQRILLPSRFGDGAQHDLVLAIQDRSLFLVVDGALLASRSLPSTVRECFGPRDACPLLIGGCADAPGEPVSGQLVGDVAMFHVYTRSHLREVKVITDTVPETLLPQYDSLPSFDGDGNLETTSSPSTTTPSLEECSLVLERAVVVPANQGRAELMLAPVSNISLLLRAENGCGYGIGPIGHIITGESTPVDMPSPSVSAGPDFANVTLRPPRQPNGVITRYLVEVSPQGASQGDILTVEANVDTAFAVISGMSPYTLYSCRVVAFNSVGSTSSSSVLFQTASAKPTGLSPPSLLSRSTDALRLQWRPASSWNGPERLYFVELLDPLDAGVVLHRSNATADTTITMLGLTPGTGYHARVIYFNGDLDAAGPPSGTLFTAATRPAGLPPPALILARPTMLVIDIKPPVMPNGQVTSYIVSVDPGNPPLPTASTPGTFNVTNLTPLTNYTIQIVACNPAGCVDSPAVTFATIESPPNHITVMAQASLATGVASISWSLPAASIVRGFQVTATQIDSCKVATDVLLDQALESGCSYRSCAAGFVSCGSTCINPQRHVCCDGAPHRIRSGHVCCGSNYVSLGADDVCCGGLVSPKLPGYQCCGSKYHLVPDGTVCCDGRVSPGNACCGGRAYSDNPFNRRLCCQGRLFDSFNNRKCCGDRAVPSGLTCCESASPSQPAISYAPLADHKCCDNQYVPDSFLCCREQTQAAAINQSELHPAVRHRAQCCGLHAFDPDTHVCSNRPTDSSPFNLQTLGCAALSRTCNTSQTAQAFCGSCHFDTASLSCVRFDDTSFDGLGPRLLARTTDHFGSCDPINDDLHVVTTQASGTSRSIDLQGLLPFTTYRIQVVAINRAGQVSNVTSVRTASAAPSEFNLTVPASNAITANTAFLSFLPARRPNTDQQLFYQVIVNGLLHPNFTIADELSSTTQIVSLLEALKPATQQTVVIYACSNVGCTATSPISFRTLPAAPESLEPPVMVSSSSTSLSLVWGLPLPQQSEPILQYSLTVDRADVMQSVFTITTNARAVLVNNLAPYSDYIVQLEACLSSGCIASSQVSMRTLEAAPAGPLAAPTLRLSPQSPAAVLVEWQEPDQPNGKLDGYSLYRNGTLIFNGTSTSFEDRQVLPYQVYQYWYDAVTGGGTTQSESASISTPAAPPEGMGVVQVAFTTEAVVQLQWAPPTAPNGPLLGYHVYRWEVGLDVVPVDGILRFDSVDQAVLLTDSLSSTQLDYTDSSVQPSRRYAYAVVAVTAEGQAFPRDTSTEQILAVSVLTSSAIPHGLQAPTLSAIVQGTVQVQWASPDQPNGAILSYILFGRRIQSPALQPSLLTTLPGNSSDLSFTHQGLEPFADYEYYVSASNEAGTTSSTWASVRTCTGPPPQSPAVVLLDASNSSLVLSWPQVENAGGPMENLRYRVFLDGALIGETFDTEFIADSLDPYTDYSVGLRACQTASCQPAPGTLLCSAMRRVTLRTSAGAPEGLLPPQVAAASETSVSISWAPPTQPNGAVLAYSIVRDGSVIAQVSSTTTLLLDTDVVPGSTYVYAIQVLAAGGTARSGTTTFTLEVVAPQGMPTPTVSLQPSPRACWQRPLAGAATVTYYSLALNGNEVAQITETTDTILCFELEGLLPDQRFDVVVSACSPAGCATSQPAVFSTPCGVSDGVQAQARNIGPATVNVTWPQPVNPRCSTWRYRLRYTVSGVGQVWTTLSFEQHQQAAVLSDLLPLTSFDIQLSVVTTAGEAAGPITTIETLGFAPSGLLRPDVEVVSATDLLVAWSPPQRLNGMITRYDVLINDEVAMSTVSELIARIPDLRPFTLYRVAVVACNPSGCTSSPLVQVRTQQAAPAGLALPEAVEVTSSSMRITWKAPSAPNGPLSGYLIEVQQCGTPTLPLPCRLVSSQQTSASTLDRIFGSDLIKPFTSYRVRLGAFNAAGRTFTEWIDDYPAECEENSFPPCAERRPLQSLAVAPRQVGQPRCTAVALEADAGSGIFCEFAEAFLIQSPLEAFVVSATASPGTDSPVFSARALSVRTTATNVTLGPVATETTFSVLVEAITPLGSASSSLSLFVPTFAGAPATTAVPGSGPTEGPTSASSDDVPISTIATIVAVACVLFLAIFILLLLAAKNRQGSQKIHAELGFSSELVETSKQVLPTPDYEFWDLEEYDVELRPLHRLSALQQDGPSSDAWSVTTLEAALQEADIKPPFMEQPVQNHRRRGLIRSASEHVEPMIMPGGRLPEPLVAPRMHRRPLGLDSPAESGSTSIADMMLLPETRLDGMVETNDLTGHAPIAETHLPGGTIEDQGSPNDIAETFLGPPTGGFVDDGQPDAAEDAEEADETLDLVLSMFEPRYGRAALEQRDDESLDGEPLEAIVMEPPRLDMQGEMMGLLTHSAEPQEQYEPQLYAGSDEASVAQSVEDLGAVTDDNLALVAELMASSAGDDEPQQDNPEGSVEESQHIERAGSDSSISSEPSSEGAQTAVEADVVETSSIRRSDAEAAPETTEDDAAEAQVQHEGVQDSDDHTEQTEESPTDQLDEHRSDTSEESDEDEDERSLAESQPSAASQPRTLVLTGLGGGAEEVDDSDNVQSDEEQSQAAVDEAKENSDADEQSSTDHVAADMLQLRADRSSDDDAVGDVAHGEIISDAPIDLGKIVDSDMESDASDEEEEAVEEKQAVYPDQGAADEQLDGQPTLLGLLNVEADAAVSLFQRLKAKASQSTAGNSSAIRKSGAAPSSTTPSTAESEHESESDDELPTPPPVAVAQKSDDDGMDELAELLGVEQQETKTAESEQESESDDELPTPPPVAVAQKSGDDDMDELAELLGVEQQETKTAESEQESESDDELPTPPPVAAAQESGQDTDHSDNESESSEDALPSPPATPAKKDDMDELAELLAGVDTSPEASPTSKSQVSREDSRSDDDPIMAELAELLAGGGGSHDGNGAKADQPASPSSDRHAALGSDGDKKAQEDADEQLALMLAAKAGSRQAAPPPPPASSKSVSDGISTPERGQSDRHERQDTKDRDTNMDDLAELLTSLDDDPLPPPPTTSASRMASDDRRPAHNGGEDDEMAELAELLDVEA